jgi:hypothetical protein
VRSGLHIVAAALRSYPAAFAWLPAHFDRLIGSDEPRRLLTATDGDPAALPALFARWERDEAAFDRLRRDMLIY